MPICLDAHLAAYLRIVIWIRHLRLLATRFYGDMDVHQAVLRWVELKTAIGWSI
jgi:hypothetical protein